MTTPDLERRAAQLYPTSPTLQAAWVEAVVWLRTSSSAGYANDKRAVRIVSRGVLHGYTAPLPPVQTHISLPDEQIMPGVVRLGRRAK
jgi:hypothetical protein